MGFNNNFITILIIFIFLLLFSSNFPIILTIFTFLNAKFLVIPIKPFSSCFQLIIFLNSN